jgi:hypothetical protein
MPESQPAARLDPVARPGAASSTPLNGQTGRPADPSIVVPAEQQASAPSKPVKPARTAGDRTGSDQLGRIEDKTARIEDKYARSEHRMQRISDKIDAAVERMYGVAQQSDLAAMRSEVAFVARRARKLPGLRSLILVSVLTSIFTAAAMLALFRYAPALGLLPR